MLIVGYGNREYVQFFIPDKVDTFSINFSDTAAVGFFCAGAPFRTAVSNSNDFHIGMVEITFKMVPTHTKTDHTCFQFSHDFNSLCFK